MYGQLKTLLCNWLCFYFCIESIEYNHYTFPSQITQHAAALWLHTEEFIGNTGNLIAATDEKQDYDTTQHEFSVRLMAIC